MKQHSKDNYQIGMLAIAALMVFFSWHLIGAYSVLPPVLCALLKIASDKIRFCAPVYSDAMYAVAGSVLGTIIILVSKHQW